MPFAQSPGLPPLSPHSPQAQAILGLWNETLAVCVVIFCVVVGLVGYCVVRFRVSASQAMPGRAHASDAAEPAQIHGHKRLEIAWTAIPFVIVVVLFGLTARTMGASDPPPAREPDLVVTGHQWWWEARYPSGVVTANEIHVPARKDLLVRIESVDVIHDFWVPQLGRKIDATPGHPTFLTMQADTPGTYLGTCAEYCGVQHAWMRIVVVADEPVAFDAWQRKQLEPAPPPASREAARGAVLFRDRTCVKCHAITGMGEGARAAPDLTHLASRATLGAGVLDNTMATLAGWLKDPQLYKPGSHMPSLRLTDEETQALVAYFEELQ